MNNEEIIHEINKLSCDCIQSVAKEYVDLYLKKIHSLINLMRNLDNHQDNLRQKVKVNIQKALTYKRWENRETYISEALYTTNRILKE